jgi:hypothetical protein
VGGGSVVFPHTLCQDPITREHICYKDVCVQSTPARQISVKPR